MLGLRGSSILRRTPSSSSQTPATNAPSNESLPTAMASPPTVADGNQKPAEMSHLTMANRPTAEKTRVIANGGTNGVVNGSASSHSEHQTSSRSETQVTRSSETRTKSTKTTSDVEVQFSTDQQITILRETVLATRAKFITEFAYVDDQYIDSMTIEGFLDYVERQRLTYMPHRGSRWDKVLKWAEFFALQISGYASAVGSFVPDSMDAARLVLAASRVLLELGPTNAQALDTTFGVFYKLGLSLSFFLRHKDLLYANAHIRMEVGQAFNALLKLVRDVGIHYHVRISVSSTKEISIDFNNVFGRHMEEFYRRKNHITDAMWEYKLGGDVSVGIRTIRHWLGPRDRTLQTILDDRLAARGRRDEYTCEWSQRYLLDFSRGKDEILAITGPAGCGKSVLAGWIVERLQRPLGRKTHQTLFYTVEADIPGKTGSVSIAKNLILQLLESNVGNVALFNALVKVHEMSLDSREASRVENALWNALDTGLGSIVAKSENIMIIVDGLDEVHGAESTAMGIRDHLANISSKHSTVQTIILSRTPVTTSKKTKIQKLEITSDHTHSDLQHLTEHALENYVHLHGLDEHRRENIAEEISHAAKGNFLWVILNAMFLKQETSLEALTKAVKAIKDTPKSLRETIDKVINTLDFSKPQTKLLLSWLLVAERPLTVTEVSCLLNVDLEKGKLHQRALDIKSELSNAYGSLVVIQNGFVRFRHSAIRSQLADIQADGKKLLKKEDAQSDLAMRLLGYCKFSLTKEYAPAFNPVDVVDVDELFHKHSLLEYAVRNWAVHFRNSSLHRDTGSYEFSNQFKAIFPSTTHLAMLEWTCWETQSSTIEAIRMHNLALRVRESILTEKHESVLQTVIICGNLYRKVSNVQEAGTCFYRACHIGQQILHQNDSITITCATTFLTVTESIFTTKRTEFVSRKEEVLKYVIGACKHQYGKTSDIVIRYYKVLAQLYVEIHEEEEAEKIWRELHEIIIIRHGKGSEEETMISEQLTIILKKNHKHEEITEYPDGIFEIISELEVWDVRRVKIIRELVVSYEKSGEYFKAEELYIILWTRLIEHSHHHHHHHHGVEVHISMIDIAIEYVRFLRRRNRHEEASSILICLWTEYEEYTFESVEIFLRLKVIGEIMRAVSLLSIAVSVFRKCWAWFSSHGHHEHVASCEVLISETVQEIVTTTIQTTTTTSTTTTTTTVTVIQELFESSISRTTVTSETIAICKSLISLYMKMEQWSQAIEVTQRSLTLIWRMVLSGGAICALPKDFGSEAIEIAMYLAICHQRSHHYHEAEEIYIRIYRASLNSCDVHDERLIKSYTILIKFYEESRHWRKMIHVYQEMLEEYRKHLGASHALTIKTLYILASLCADHGHGSALSYYEEIVLVINGKSRVCHHDAREALMVVCRIYYEEGHWSKLHDTCVVLWETWTHHHHEHKFSQDFIELLYIRYRYVLEHHIHCEYEVLRTITIQYRETCTKVFGASVSITIKALLEFAQLCLKSEKYIQEAITAYEEVLTKTTTTMTSTTTTTVISSTTITTIKEQLSKAYVIVCSYGSTSTTTIERAIKILSERFEYLKITFGCSRMETLIALRELLLLYLKLKTKEAHATIVRMLMETTIQIIVKEKNAKILFEAAKFLGGIYISCGLHDYGHEILRELRVQIVTGKGTPGTKFVFKVDKSIGRVSYVFLVTFEETLRGSMTISYSEIMANLLIETFLYESYTRCMKDGGLETILITCARLRAFLVTRGHGSQSEAMEHQVYEIFLKKWGTSINTRTEITKVFYISLLEVLGKISHEVQFDKGKIEIEIGDAACIAVNNKVGALLEQGSYQEAYDVAVCAYQFITHRHAYKRLESVPHAFKLSSYLAFRGVKKPSDKPVEHELNDKMLELSRTIIREVLQVCKESRINFARLKLRELNELVGLLGQQKNYVDLARLLNDLWSSREVQKTWSRETIIAIGKRLVQAQFLIEAKRPKATRLCEDICYNVRRAWGSLHPKTLKISDLLSACYTSTGHYREAMAVHEEILRLVVEGDDDDDRTIDTVTPKVARQQLGELKRCYQRLRGWDKNPEVYKDIVTRLINMREFKGQPEFKGVQAVEKWNVEEKPGTEGEFTAPKEWMFKDSELVTGNGQVTEHDQHRHHHHHKQPGFLRAVSNWGMEVIHGALHGANDYDHGKANGMAVAANGGGFGNPLPKVR